MSKVSKLTMNKDDEHGRLQEIVELIPQNARSLEYFIIIWRNSPYHKKVNIVAEQMRIVLLLLKNRMACIFAGTTVSNFMPWESSLLWTIFISGWNYSTTWPVTPSEGLGETGWHAGEETEVCAHLLGCCPGAHRSQKTQAHPLLTAQFSFSWPDA